MDTEPDKEYTASLMQTMYQYSLKRVLTDLAVRVRGRTVTCHQMIIFAKSKEFVHLCQSGGLEMVLDELVDREYQADIVDSLIKFLYLGNCNITTDNVSSLLRVAKRIKLKDLEKKCEQHLVSEFSKEELVTFMSSRLAMKRSPQKISQTDAPSSTSSTLATKSPATHSADVRKEILILGGKLPEGTYHRDIVFLEKDAGVADLPAAPMLATVSTSSISACVNEHFLIVSGGYDLTTKRSVATVQIFDVNRKRWSNLPDLPHPAHWHGTTLVNGNMYSLGGCHKENGKLKHQYNFIHKIELPGGKWIECGARLPSAVSSPGIATVEDDIVIVGGWTGSGFTAQTSRFNTKNNKLTQCQPMPRPDNPYRATVTVEKCIYVLSDGQFLCYDLCSDSWSRLAMPMKPSYKPAMVLKQHRLIAMGGHEGDLKNPNDRVQVYDLKTKKWGAQKNMPLKLTFHWAFVMKHSS